MENESSGNFLTVFRYSLLVCVIYILWIYFYLDENWKHSVSLLFYTLKTIFF